MEGYFGSDIIILNRGQKTTPGQAPPCQNFGTSSTKRHLTNVRFNAHHTHGDCQRKRVSSLEPCDSETLPLDHCGLVNFRKT
ncbi:hypothetical protein AVEN_228800-1 [Araneus ventricosus]|uniref:Uncharacterized protein n=1 Tax=Araneus ventricosus TaxID=182803 RepID=A0A4Y2V107_ARAVE|nr:hypothetical protein AVEN_228800-1 [Araneus ventricosus]